MAECGACGQGTRCSNPLRPPEQADLRSQWRPRSVMIVDGARRCVRLTFRSGLASRFNPLVTLPEGVADISSSGAMRRRQITEKAIERNDGE
jgi:hypothetical protein